MSQSGLTDRTAFNRKIERGSHDREEAHAILDAARVGHLGYTLDGQPYVLPIAFGRDGEDILFHGSTGARSMRALAAGAACCFTVTHVDGLVLARSAFNSSMNFRSLMVLGTCDEITDPDAKWRALDAVTDHLFPERRRSLRPMTRKEVAATMVLRLPLTEFSIKARSGGPNDDGDDVLWPVWAGELPISTSFGAAVPAANLDERLSTPALLSLWQA